ncbi:MAG: Acetylornithine deacetylase [bacterium ADurb.Bin478]|nr:MAG: Acetylornithine deacetylase [bacterium ADurb.Bin478]
MFDLLKTLIDIDSCTGREPALGHWLCQWLMQRGYQVERQDVGAERFNLIVRACPSPVVWFCTHLDTVEPFVRFRQEHGRIYGRGACDAKGSLWAMLSAVERLRRRPAADVGLLLVVGEEHDSDGAKMLARSGVTGEYIILGEPTDNHLVSHQKGSLVFRITVRGRSGHSGYPERGSSAIHHLTQILSTWLHHDWGEDAEFGKTTVNIGRIQGGSGANIIADHAQADGIFRLATDPEEIRRQWELTKDDAVRVEVLSASQPQRLFTLPGYPVKTVAFGSDAAYLAPLARVLMLGPGSIHFAHREDEQVGVDELIAACDLYEKLALDLLYQAKR